MHIRAILQLSVDKDNNRGGDAAIQILNTLHSLAGECGYRHGGKGLSKGAPYFTFQIIAHKGVIHFYIRSDEKFRHILEDQLYAQYPEIQIREMPDPIPLEQTFLLSRIIAKEYSLSMIRSYTSSSLGNHLSQDPYTSITSSMAKVEGTGMAVFHVDFAPILDTAWRSEAKKGILSHPTYPRWVKQFILYSYGFISVLFSPFIFFRILSKVSLGGETGKNIPTSYPKTQSYGYEARIFIGVSEEDSLRQRILFGELQSSLGVFSDPNGNSLTPLKATYESGKIFSTRPRFNTILNTSELAGLVHMPTNEVTTPGISWLVSKTLEPPPELPTLSHDATPLGVTNFRGKNLRFGIRSGDRMRHTYIIGKTGMGKSTLLENMIYADILAGKGVAVIDPHGDLAETILRNIPKSRTNDVILFDPSDRDFPTAFNMLESPDRAELYPAIASGLLSVFKRIFGEKSWGPRLEYILRNTIFTLLYAKDTTLLSIPIILTHASYRHKIVSKIDDPVLRQFWTQEFEKMPPNIMSEAVNPILNKVGQFLSSPLLRNILGQTKNTFSLRWMMDRKKIFIVNLSKGKIGEDGSELLGSMLVTRFQLEAMSRADIPEKERVPFGLFVDEFQNFATDSFATILSEARKYGLSLTLANQYIMQMTESIQNAVFGNVGTTIAFQVGYHDAEILQQVFGGEKVLRSHDLMNLPKYDIYTKLLINGMPSPVFSATTFPPLRSLSTIDSEQDIAVIRRVIREKYTKPRESIEGKIQSFARKVLEEEKVFQEQKTVKKGGA